MSDDTAKPAKSDASPYNVARLAKDLGIETASVRVALRNAEIEKTGKSYEWPNKTEYQRVLSALKSRGDKPEKAAPKKKTAPKKTPKKAEVDPAE